MNDEGFIVPQWPAPPRVRSLITTRAAGDQQSDEGRARLRERVPAEPLWLRQVHGTHVVDARGAAPRVEADGAVARGPGPVLAVLTADCLPVLLCDRSAETVAVAHAGWRGLAAGVIESAVQAMDAKPSDVLAFIGPGIGPRAYEVGPEVRDAFVSADSDAAMAFTAGREGRFFADLYALARQRLAKTGIMAVFGAEFCTFNERDRFFSYRRDGVTGRMASLIWLERS
jgi:YfiH family protein